jgi:formamidopyrimidine-DNA glycosylase
MPELPEVETTRRGIEPALQGVRIDQVILRRPNLRIPFPDGFAERLAGQRIDGVSRRAKYILITLEDGAVVILHLGMSGRLAVLDDAPSPGPHDHVDIVLETGKRIRFCDPRRFGLLTLAEPGAVDSHRLLAHLGPDPLGNQFNDAVLAERLRGRGTSIKAALLDQTVVAGLGNIYVCESLYRARISPKRLARNVQGARAERLTGCIRDVLNDALAAGGSSLRDYQKPTGELGYFQHSFDVYDREGERCLDCDCDAPAGGGIQRLVQGGRSTFYCPHRQR